MKENHRVESLKALSQSARRKRIRRFESSARVYAYSFDNANESKLSDESTTLIYKESQRLDAPPPSNRVLRRSNSPSQRPERKLASWAYSSVANRWFPGFPLPDFSPLNEGYSSGPY